MAIDYSELIPNNVNLADNRRLQRALEEWQPKFLDWWKELGPEGYQAADVYLRTATSVDAQGWAQFGRVRMPDYRWGIFLAEPEAERRISHGEHKGQPVWQDVPGEYRAVLRRLIVTHKDQIALTKQIVGDRVLPLSDAHEARTPLAEAA